MEPVSVATLAGRFGEDNSTDVLAGTGLEGHAENLALGSSSSEMQFGQIT